MEDYLTNLDNYKKDCEEGDDIIAELAATKKTKSKPDNEGYLPIDVFQAEDKIIIRSTIAGANPDNIDVFITKNMVTIKGFREPDYKAKPSDYFHRELYWGHFSRAVILPADIDADKAKATFKNSILTLSLPKL